MCSETLMLRKKNLGNIPETLPWSGLCFNTTESVESATLLKKDTIQNFFMAIFVKFWNSYSLEYQQTTNCKQDHFFRVQAQNFVERLSAKERELIKERDAMLQSHQRDIRSLEEKFEKLKSDDGKTKEKLKDATVVSVLKFMKVSQYEFFSYPCFPIFVLNTKFTK